MPQEEEKIPEVGVWAEFAQEMGGTFTEGPHSKPSIMHIAVPGMVQYVFNDYEILIDTIVSQGTENQTPRLSSRFRTLITNPNKFRFKVYQQHDDFLMTATKFLRLLQDVELGDPAFDDQYVLQGTDETLVKQLFSDQTLQTLLASMAHNARLQVLNNDPNFFKKRLPKGVDILVWTCRGLISDLESMRSAKELFHYTLTRLIEMKMVDALVPDVRMIDYR